MADVAEGPLRARRCRDALARAALRAAKPTGDRQMDILRILSVIRRRVSGWHLPAMTGSRKRITSHNAGKWPLRHRLRRTVLPWRTVLRARTSLRTDLLYTAVRYGTTYLIIYILGLSLRRSRGRRPERARYRTGPQAGTSAYNCVAGPRRCGGQP